MFNENLETWSSQDGEGTYGICCINLIIASVSLSLSQNDWKYLPPILQSTLEVQVLKDNFARYLIVDLLNVQ